jgi:cysteine dioxygenase
MSSNSMILILFDLLTTGQKFLKGDENKNELVEFYKQHLISYAKRFDDWKIYALSSPLHYTRNLVNDNDELEVIILVWLPGQVSRIHDHAGSNCYMVVLEGEVYEKRFLQVDNDDNLVSEGKCPTPVPGKCPTLREIRSSILHFGEVSHIHDQEGVHLVGNNSSTPSITLHVYAPPIKRVKVFDPSSNETLFRTPGFFSVHGRKTGKQ